MLLFTLLILVASVMAQNDPNVTTWQYSGGFNNAECSGSPVEQLWARAVCTPGPASACDAGSTPQTHQCIENPVFEGTLGSQLFAGSGLTCTDNILGGEGVQQFAEFTFSSGASLRCLNTTMDGAQDSFAYFCDASQKVLTVEQYSSSDCSGTSVSSQALPLGCFILQDTQAMILNPAICSIAGKGPASVSLRTLAKKTFTAEQVAAVLPQFREILLKSRK